MSSSDQEPKTQASRLRSAGEVPDTQAGVLFQSTESLSKGALFGRYLVLGVLGQGGMGEVLAAYDPELDRKIAIKRLRQAAYGNENTLGRERLKREAKAMARLSHPNVLTLYGVEQVGDEVCLVMELVEGTTLKEELKDGLRDWRSILDLFRAAGEGLIAAHDAGLVHRDFKPSNILVGRDGRVRVMDFGIARTAGPAPDELASEETLPVRPDETAGLTQAGQLLGTVGYMAPEQIEGGVADARTDQFAFCTTLYEALYRQRPFPGRTVVEFAEALGRQPQPSPGSGVPAWVTHVVLRGLSRDPGRRFSSMRELLAELGRDPSRARARAVWIVAGAAALLALGGGLRFAWTLQERQCSGAPQKLAGVWDGPRQAAIAAAFDATGSPLAKSTFIAVQQLLGRWAGSWSEAYRETCEATRVRGEQSEDVLTLRMACLEGERTKLRALSDLLAAADASLVEKAVAAAGRLGDLSECADVEALRAPVKPPQDPEVRARVESLRAQLAQAKALIDTARYELARKLLGTVASAADALGYPPLAAETHERMGELELETGSYAPAAGSLQRAVREAEIGRDDAVRAQSWLELAEAVGAKLARVDEGREDAQLGAAILTHLAGRDDLKSLLQSVLSDIDVLAGRCDDAVAEARAGLAVRERLYGPDHPEIAAGHRQLGRAFMCGAKFGEARAEIEQDLAILEKTYGSDHPAVAVDLDVLAVSQANLGDYGAALASYRRAVGILERTLGPDNPTLGAPIYNVGDTLVRLGRYDDAAPALDQALAIFRKLGPRHPNVALVLSDRGLMEIAQGKASSALTDCRDAVAMTEAALGPDGVRVEVALNCVGGALLALGRAQDALPIAERALRIAEHEKADPMDLADTRFVVSRALRASGKEPERATQLASAAEAGYRALRDEVHLAQVGAFLGRGAAARGP